MKLLDKKLIIYQSWVVPESFKGCPEAGIYFLIKNDDIVYVGKSIHLRGRLTTHKKNKDFERVYWIGYPKDTNLYPIEVSYIEAFLPSQNIAMRPDLKKPMVNKLVERLERKRKELLQRNALSKSRSNDPA